MSSQLKIKTCDPSVAAVRSYLTEADWLPYKDEILSMRQKNVTLSKIQKTIKDKYGFVASVSQYKGRLKSWESKQYFSKAERRLILQSIACSGPDKLPRVKSKKGKIPIDRNRILNVWKRRREEIGLAMDTDTPLDSDKVMIMISRSPSPAPGDHGPRGFLEQSDPMDFDEEILRSLAMDVDMQGVERVTVFVSRSPSPAQRVRMSPVLAAQMDCSGFEEGISSNAAWELDIMNTQIPDDGSRSPSLILGGNSFIIDFGRPMTWAEIHEFGRSILNSLGISENFVYERHAKTPQLLASEAFEDWVVSETELDVDEQERDDPIPREMELDAHEPKRDDPVLREIESLTPMTGSEIEAFMSSEELSGPSTSWPFDEEQDKTSQLADNDLSLSRSENPSRRFHHEESQADSHGSAHNSQEAERLMVEAVLDILSIRGVADPDGAFYGGHATDYDLDFGLALRGQFAKKLVDRFPFTFDHIDEDYQRCPILGLAQWSYDRAEELKSEDKEDIELEILTMHTLPIVTMRLGETHIISLRIQLKISKRYGRRGHHERAIHILENIRPHFSRILGPNHLQTRKCYRYLGVAFRFFREFSKSFKAFWLSLPEEKENYFTSFSSCRPDKLEMETLEALIDLHSLIHTDELIHTDGRRTLEIAQKYLQLKNNISGLQDPRSARMYRSYGFTLARCPGRISTLEGIKFIEKATRIASQHPTEFDHSWVLEGDHHLMAFLIDFWRTHGHPGPRNTSLLDDLVPKLMHNRSLLQSVCDELFFLEIALLGKLYQNSWKVISKEIENALLPSQRAEVEFSRSLKCYQAALEGFQLTSQEDLTLLVLNGIRTLFEDRGLPRYSKPLSYYTIKRCERALGMSDSTIIKAILNEVEDSIKSKIIIYEI